MQAGDSQNRASIVIHNDFRHNNSDAKHLAGEGTTYEKNVES